jgi:phthiocerol/phenolphthiocerol synthesis type-I polyketide synthase E
MTLEQYLEDSVAIVGLACRFPGARDLNEYWNNLRQGVESITFFSEQELRDAGIDDVVWSTANFVPARGSLRDIEMFDAAFFGYSPREAEILDPQQRLFLECAWQTLEHAGYDPGRYRGRIGVFAGIAMSSYLDLVRSRLDILETLGSYQVGLANDKDFVTTRTSYKLNLRGPSMAIQTACSASLVSVHVASRSVLTGESDMALAGGVAINAYQVGGYFYEEGSIVSPDGHCRAFDAQAAGSVDGNGVGLVLIKRALDAVNDGDTIYALIRGSAVNNDGSAKAGYMAPGVDGQAEVITDALAIAGIDPETIGYIEAHGTGTLIGDPLEIAALTRAFRTRTERKGYCAIGSVKTNIGHLDIAAGIAGLIKTVKILQEKEVPPSLHFRFPNPHINFADSPFYVNTTLTAWPEAATPRRAGVSSFGIGGTNAHVLLEEAPSHAPRALSSLPQLLILSARSRTALDQATLLLRDHLVRYPQLDLADVAFTLQVGRHQFSHRRMVLCQQREDAIAALSESCATGLSTIVRDELSTPIMYLFSDQGSQYPQMAANLYSVETLFREQIDRCATILRPFLGLDFRQFLFEPDAQMASILDETWLTQPILFSLEYALAKLWMSWGVHPQAMIGHSLGEYVAACLAEVFSLEDALAIVAARGRLMQQLPGGTMLSVSLSEREVRPFLGQNLALAVNNGPSLCVISGPTEAIDALEHQFSAQGVDTHRLFTSHALHSAMMDPMLEPFVAQLKQISFQPPKIPYISNLTGTWITAEEATDPCYWARHLRQTVRFSEGIQELLKTPHAVLLEVGPGKALSTLVQLHLDQEDPLRVFTSLRHLQEHHSDLAFLLNTLGNLWLVGVDIDWSGVSARLQGRRVPLPSYPFERQRFWVDGHKNTHLLADKAPQDPSPSPPTTTPSHEEHTLSLYPRSALLGTYIAPTSEIEHAIVAIWQGVLGIAQVSIHDNFFEIGGNSLIAAQIISRLRKTFPIEFPLRLFFEVPTVAELARAIEDLLVEAIDLLSEEEAVREVGEYDRT